jgi:HSP20 family protein
MSLIRYGPRAMAPWFDFDRLFEDFEPAFGLMRSTGEKAWAPAVDIYEDEKEIVIKADLPEVKEEDIDVHVEDGQMTIKGERKFEHEEKRDNYHRVERRYGSFQRTFALPETVDADHIAAKYDKGVLKVTLPKTAKPKNARTIPVK